VTYPTSPASRFDFDYYRSRHIPLIWSLFRDYGLMDARFIRGVAIPGGGPIAYHLVALLSFSSADAFGRGGARHGDEIGADIANFTNVTPILQINEEFGAPEPGHTPQARPSKSDDPAGV